MTTMTPAAERKNHEIAMAAARAHFAGRRPTCAEADEYANDLAFRAAKECRDAGIYGEAEYASAEDARYFARAAALELYHSTK